MPSPTLYIPIELVHPPYDRTHVHEVHLVEVVSHESLFSRQPVVDGVVVEPTGIYTIHPFSCKEPARHAITNYFMLHASECNPLMIPGACNPAILKRMGLGKVSACERITESKTEVLIYGAATKFLCPVSEPRSQQAVHLVSKALESPDLLATFHSRRDCWSCKRTSVRAVWFVVVFILINASTPLIYVRGRGEKGHRVSPTGWSFRDYFRPVPSWQCEGIDGNARLRPPESLGNTTKLEVNRARIADLSCGYDHRLSWRCERCQTVGESPGATRVPLQTTPGSV
jgi:hypothetical protein